MINFEKVLFRLHRFLETHKELTANRLYGRPRDPEIAARLQERLSTYRRVLLKLDAIIKECDESPTKIYTDPRQMTIEFNPK